MRLLYSGPSDHQALVKRFEDADIETALANGWRLTRRNPGDVESDEPGADAPNLFNDEGKRLDGPTFEEYVAAGYPPASYPPLDYAEKPSDGLTAYRQAQADEATAQAALAAADQQAHAGDDDAAQTDSKPAEQRPEDPEPPSNESPRKTRRR